MAQFFKDSTHVSLNYSLAPIQKIWRRFGRMKTWENALNSFDVFVEVAFKVAINHLKTSLSIHFYSIWIMQNGRQHSVDVSSPTCWPQVWKRSIFALRGITFGPKALSITTLGIMTFRKMWQSHNGRALLC